MIKKIFILTLFYILLILVTVQNIFSQVTQEWVARYDGPGNSTDLANSIAVDGSGNVYVTGYCTASGTDYDYATIKYNSSGVMQWEKRYNGTGNLNDYASSIAIDVSGNVYVTGQSEGTGSNFDYATIKYNSSGVQQWVQRYNGPGNYADAARSIAVDGLGNVYVTGSGTGSGTGVDYATIKYNSSGDSVWVKRYNSNGNSVDAVSKMAVDGSGNVYVTGYSAGSGTGYDYATIKYNSSGVQQWVKIYNGPGNLSDYANSISVDNSGNVYVAGQSRGSGTAEDYATIKYNSSGDSVWVQRYNGTGNLSDGANSIAVDGSGNVFVTGSSTGSGTDFDYATLKYNSSGILQWLKRYNGPINSSDYANSIALDGSGNVYVTGQSPGSGLSYDYTTIKYNSSGDSVWVKRYNGPANSTDNANSIALDGSGNVFVTGQSEGSGTGTDYATVKYSQSVGINQISSEIPDKFSLSQNYPNPFNPVTKINYELRVTNYAKLVVYDVIGKEVVTLVNEKQSPGTYQVEFDAGSLTSGIYFYRLTSGDFTDTRRMMLIK
ncbi:MAG: SBBP repeat-containing protein [Ignavibacteria bacterium]|nr:SBBP repeat-containing protein [Ignavibacteria bacterium]